MQTNAPRTLQRKRKLIEDPHTATITETSKEGPDIVHSIKDRKSSSLESTTAKHRTEDEEQQGTLHSSQQLAFDEKEETLKSLFKWLRKHDWATSYYDTEHGICVHVNAHVMKKEKAAQNIEKQFPLLKSLWKYEVVETDSGTCQTLSKTAGFNGSGML